MGVQPLRGVLCATHAARSRQHRAALGQGREEPAGATAKLAGLGYTEAAATLDYLAAVRTSSRYRDLPTSSRGRFDTLVPRLIEQSAKTMQADLTLKRCLTLVETISRRAAYLAMLDEHPHALERIAAMLSSSSWAADYLTRHPILLDELLDTRLLHAEPDWPGFEQNLRAEPAQHQAEKQAQNHGENRVRGVPHA